MKRIINICVGIAVAMAFAACSDDFLEEKQNYDNVTPEIYNTSEGCQLRVNDVYAWSLPDVAGSPSWKYVSTGNNDDQATSTEEYAGFGAFVDPQSEMNVISGTSVVDYFFGSANNIQANAWGRIRNINDAIEGVEGGTLDDEEKDEYLGQLYFFRAWCYYLLVKWYGGVPLVTEVQDPVEGVYTPRSTTKETIEFICSDLDIAAQKLAASTLSGGWSNSGDDWGKVTTGTALALKGRVLLLWASPLFNRANDQTRWTNAYSIMKAELDSIDACGYGLYSSSSSVNGSDFCMQFNQSGVNPEAVFVTLYNNINVESDEQKNNPWERYIRPKNTSGTGKTPASMIVDLFPMADGKRPATADTYTLLDASDYDYDSEYPFMNRDPRFYHTFAFPGVRWAYSGGGSITTADANNPSYNNGADYELWNYVWYTDEDDIDNDESTSYGADNLLSNKCGLYVRKRSDDYDFNSSAFYSFAATANVSGFAYSAQPYIELRYAEVLLNLAEVACGAGDMAYAVELLQRIRARVGYTSDNNYGLQTDLSSDQAKCMSAIIYERQVELAYEGKRFDDLRRWMLYDGGTGKVDNAPSTWTLTGWGGNTCTWLGFKQLNGQRRETMEFRVADAYGVGGTTVNDDPLVNAGVERCDAIDLTEDLTEQQEVLKEWYSKYLVRKEKKGDARDSNQIDLYINFLPRYYFLGLGSAAQSNNSLLPQTIGWEDYNNGGADGTFDPLAE